MNPRECIDHLKFLVDETNSKVFALQDLINEIEAQAASWPKDLLAEFRSLFHDKDD